ncbi:sodium-dependent glucose transporter 1-like isoform X1 [Ruditapes philippinarum]|uniref:sodium-dependent glucose transporter 1-like isoform X1 n=1 Tax=Ruditapes philippinarum TaxID=129788 RepID=UPI00295B816E|nr:sodium-dependent glucose transporter 1-like isoform X1 [Ruditapes philippinarum]
MPLLSDPFLGTMIPFSSNNTIQSNDTGILRSLNVSVTEPSSDSTDKYYIENSRIEYPFAISGIATASLSIIFFLFQIIEYKYTKHGMDNHAAKGEMAFPNSELPSADNDNGSKSKKVNSEINSEMKRSKWEKLKLLIQLINPASCANGRFWYGFSIIFLMFFYFGNAGGGQFIVSNFVRSYSIDQLQFSSENGTLINTSYWISFSIGRFLFFIFAKWTSVKILIFVEAFGATFSAVLMAIFADESSIALWVLIQPIAFFWGPVWPTGVAWTDYHMVLTGMGMTSQMLGAALGGMFHMRLIGYLYDNIGPKTYLYHVAGSAAFGLILAIALNVIGARHGNRFATEVEECVDEQNETDKNSNELDGKISTRL